MARCAWCEQEMKVTRSCSVEVLHRGGMPIAMIPWGREFPRWSSSASRCGGDCGVRPGGVDIPETNITVHRGIRCTTPLRTVIDIAPDTDDDLDRIVDDCLRCRLFTLDEARSRLADADMEHCRGAHQLRRALDRRKRRA